MRLSKYDAGGWQETILTNAGLIDLPYIYAPATHVAMLVILHISQSFAINATDTTWLYMG